MIPPERELPRSWQWVSFGTVGRVASNLVSPAAFPDSPHIAPNHIEGRTGRLLSHRTVAEDGVTSPKHLFRQGQLLYSKIRPYLAKVVEAPDSGLCSADMYPIETALLPRYLLYWLLTPEFTQYASHVQGRTVLPKINRAQLEALPVPVAPELEQKRIVAAIEEQLSRIDAGVQALESALMRIETLTKAVLVAAVHEFPPATWAMSTVGEAGEVRLGRQRSPKFHTGPNMRPYLRVANVFEDRIDTSDIMTMQFSEEEFAQYQLQHGDVLLNEGQSPHLLGRPAIYQGDPPSVAYTNSLIRFRANRGVLPSWALLVFRRHLHARRFMAESQITTNIAHLSARRFKSIEFPIPPMDEQKLIVDAVYEQLSMVKVQRLAVQRSLIQARRLRRSILAAAFSGKLVRQELADEPASIALERIATERAISNGHEPARSRKSRTKVTT